MEEIIKENADVTDNIPAKEPKDDVITEASSDAAESTPTELQETNGKGTDEAPSPAESTEEPKQAGFRSFLDKTVERLKKVNERYGFSEMLLMRLIGVFMLISGINLQRIQLGDGQRINSLNSWKEYVGEVSFPLLLLWGLCGVSILTFIYSSIPKRYRIFDQTVAIIGSIFFGIEMMWRNTSFYNCLGVMLVVMVFTAYAMKKTDTEVTDHLPKWLSPTIIFICAGGVCAFAATTTVCHHLIYGTSTFDFGIFVQMFHSMKEHFTAVTTCERDVILSHFNVHASFIYYLLLPFYAIFPSPNTLLIAQAILSMGGIIPFYLLLKKHDFKGVPMIGASFLYIFCTGIVFPCYYDFHENAFLPTILMWLLYAVDSKKMPLFYIMSFLTCMVKEDAPLYVFCIALYFLFEEKSSKRWNSLVIILVSGIYFVAITNWLTQNGDGSMMTSSRFGHLQINEAAGFAGIVKNILSNPSYFFSLFFKEESLIFFLQIMLPLCFLPFLTKKISRFLLMLPFVIMNLVVGANFGYACMVNYQYIFGPSCLLIYISILNAEDFGKEKRNTFMVAGAAASMILLTSTISDSIAYVSRYKVAHNIYQAMDDCLDRVPLDAKVAINTWYLPHIAQRDYVYLLDGADLKVDPADPNNKIMTEPERYDVVILSPGDENTCFFVPDLEKHGFRKVDEAEGQMYVYYSPNYQPAAN